MWLNRLKIAVIEKDVDALDKLLNDLPKLRDKRELEEAIYLLREATNVISSLKSETAASLEMIKKNLDFLNSTRIRSSKNLDIRL